MGSRAAIALAVAAAVVLGYYYFFVMRPKAAAAAGAGTGTGTGTGTAAAAPSGGGVVRARYVRIQSTTNPPLGEPRDGIVDLAGLSVSRNGAVINPVGGTLFPPSGDPNMVWSNLGRADSPTRGNVWTSGTTAGSQYIELDLGADREIDSLTFRMRSDEPWRQRALNYTAFLYDATRKPVWQRPAGGTVLPVYTFAVSA